MSDQSRVNLYSRLLGYSWKYWKAFLIALAAMLFTAATETAIPALMKPLIDKGFQGSITFALWWVPLAVLTLFFVRGASSFLAIYTMQWISNKVLADIRCTLFDKLITLPASTFDTRSSGQLISRVISETQTVLLAATHVVTVLIRDSLMLFGLFLWLFWLNWKLTLVVAILIPLLALLTLKFAKRMRRVSYGQMAAMGDMTGAVEEAISGNRVIKIFGGAAYERDRFAKVNSDFRGQAMRLAVAQALQSPISQLIAAIGLSAVLMIALLQSRAGEATIGDFVSFITAMLLMFAPLRHLSDVNAQLQRSLAAAEGVFSLIDERSEVDQGTRDFGGRVLGNISFFDVSVKYASRGDFAIDNFTLHVPAGRTYALVGPSGSGKSSLVNLLPRLYEASSGRIEIDGFDIRDVPLSALRSQIALVSQDVVLFNDSILKNITYGQADVPLDHVWRAVNAADLKSFVTSLPEGLETIVGDRGVRLSGGQRQRIAIARAIIKDAPILIMDEATSALDNVSESNVKRAIDHLRKHRTTLIVAHRLTTVLSADQIVVMDHGKITQQGTHQELITAPGLYQSLYLQMQKADANSTATPR